MIQIGRHLRQRLARQAGVRSPLRAASMSPRYEVRPSYTQSKSVCIGCS
jgi:formate hydrogenlyase subunit 6/NADH:ubiquinone oxidoreductase subunit I